MRYYLVAGEASGDLHGSLLIRSLKNLDPDSEFRFIGGDLMIKESQSEPYRHLKDISFMGFLEVLKNLPNLLRNLKEVKKDIILYRPDALILIDFPGFNLRLASKAKRSGIPVYYYISPKVWAWNSKRVIHIKKNIDHMFVIFPFEVHFYKKWGMEVDYVGNPIMDSIESFENHNEGFNSISGIQKPIMALLPGSRKQEIESILPIMLEVVSHFQDYQFVLAGAPGFSEEYYKPLLKDTRVPILFGETYSILSQATLALVTSGTATLETALLQIPEVVLYKTSRLSYEIGKKVIRVPFISLVNLIMERVVVKELIQDQCNPENLIREIQRILPGQMERNLMLESFQILREKVGPGGASLRTAQKIFNYIKS